MKLVMQGHEYFRQVCLTLAFLLNLPSVTPANGEGREWESDVTSVTISLADAAEDTLHVAALQLANDDEFLDPTFVPLRLTRGVFEFRLSPQATADVAMADLRTRGFLVNPVITYADNRFIRYTDRITVTFDPGLPITARDEAHAAVGCRVLGENRASSNRETVEITAPNGRSTLDIARQYSALAVCVSATPEAYITMDMYDEDPVAYDYRDLQWSLDNRGQSGGTVDADIDAPYAWRVTKGSDSVLVAVLDCAFCPHPDTLEPVSNVTPYDANLYGYESWEHTCVTCTTEAAVSTVSGRTWCAHGSMVLGVLAAAHNNYGIDGMAPHCKFAAIKMCQGLTNCPVDYPCMAGANTVYADALRHANALGAKIIVQTTDWLPDKDAPAFANPDSLLHGALTVLDSLRRYEGVAVFAAAGNTNNPIRDVGVVLAHDSLVFAIGATDHSDERWSWSNYGPQLAFMAPTETADVEDSCTAIGIEPTWDPFDTTGLSPLCNPITSRCHEDEDSYHICGGAGGTSFAAPKVAGVAALVLSYRPDFFDSADVGMALYNVLKLSAEMPSGYSTDTIADTLYGWGRVNALRALALVSRRGDVNMDGQIDVLDVQEIISIAFGGKHCTGFYGSLVDLNCDTTIDVLDVSGVINVAFRGVSESSCASVYDAGLDICCDRPTLIAPLDRATDVSLPVTLYWGTPKYWITGMTLMVDDSPDFDSPIVSTNLSDTSYEVSGLDSTTTYYWKVVSHGSDCGSVASVRSFTTAPSSPAYESITNSITVESREVPCGAESVDLGIFVSNNVSLSALVLPLEIRSVSGNAYTAGPLNLQVANRLGDSLILPSPIVSYLPEKDAQGGACGGVGFAGRGDFEEPDLTSPDGIVYIGIAYADSQMLGAGSDGEPGDGDPSLVLTFDVSSFGGSFEIDTTCVSPSNHFLFVDGGDSWYPNAIVPAFTKGVITVTGTSELSGHVSDHDTLACHVSLIGDVTIDSGASLTVLPGRTVQAKSFHDTTSGGLDPDLAEIIVYGELTLGDSAGAAPLLTGDSATPGAWYGIRVMPGGRLNVGTGAVIQNAVVGITLDSLADVDSLTRLEISNCDVAGIWSFGSAAVIADNLIYDIPEGYGIGVWDADPLILGNTITNCETGIDVLRSSSQVRGNVINGPGMQGIFVSHYDVMYPGLDTLRVIDNEVLGYFSVAHLFAGSSGHCRIDSCEFISQYVTGEQSPYGIKVAQGVWTKIRRTKIQAFGSAGVYSYKSITNLGKNKYNNGGVDDFGFNVIHTDSAVGCEEICFTKCVSHVGLTSTDTLRAEGNWWDSVPPPSFWFSTLVDRTPYLEEDPLGKLVADLPVAADVPRSTSLGQNYPNPFNPSTTVSFSIAVRTKVRLVIYNTLGQQVSVLADRDYEPGQHALTWDGRDEDGNRVASGVYFYRLTAGDFVESRKMVLLK